MSGLFWVKAAETVQGLYTFLLVFDFSIFCLKSLFKNKLNLSYKLCAEIPNSH